MEREIVLQARGIKKSYKGHMALNDADITVRRGDIYGFVGRNGAGKTTLIRILSGLSLPDEGEYALFGVPGRSRAINGARKRICAMVESPAVYPELSAEENMRIQCMIVRRPYDGARELLRFVGLPDTGKRRVRDFSLGMRQRLAIAMALVGEPELMLLDEPINGLDPEGIRDVREMLLKLNRERGITILISSHILTELSLFATVYGFIADGHVVRETTAEEIFAATAERCRLVTDNDPAALPRLRAMGYRASMGEGGIDVATDVDLMRVCEDFRSAGIRLEKHIHAAIDLESYYMKLLEGKA